MKKHFVANSYPGGGGALNKAFTLIEVIAVIIVMAIIALIATPIVINVIDKAEEESRKNSVRGYADSVRLSYAEEILKNTGKPLKELATLKTQGQEVDCEYVKYDDKKSGTLLHSCKVDGKGNYCYINGYVYQDGTDECNNIINLIMSDGIPYNTPNIYVVSQIPDGLEFSQSKEISVEYPSLKVVEEKYFIKSSETLEISAISKCGSEETPFECTEENVSSIEPNRWYQVSGNVSFTVNKNVTIEAIIGNKNEYGSKKTYEVSNIDTTEPSISIKNISTTSNKIIVSAECEDLESNIIKQEYAIDGISYQESNVFNNLSSTSTYKVKVRCTNGSGISKEVESEEISLNEITKPTITYQNIPDSAVNGYLKSQTIKVTYNNTNIDEPTYYVKTTREGVSSIAVTQSCGTGTTPSNCSTITSTTSLAANTWYKVSGNVNVTYNTYATSEGTLYAITYDGTNFSGAVTGVISKITKDVTYIVKHYQMNTDMTNYTLYETETLTGAANYTATPSVKTYTGFNSPSTQTVTVAADGSTIVEYKYARKQVVVTFYRNTSSSDTTTATQTFTYGVTGQKFTSKGWTKSGSTQVGWTATASGTSNYAVTNGVNDSWINKYSPNTKLYAMWVENPTITFTNTPTTAVNGYLTKQVATVKYPTANLTTPTYYIKTTRAGTSNIAVTSSCGTSTNPGTCSTITSTTSLAANTWYKVSGNLTVTYTAASTSTGTIYAFAYDGTTKRTTATATISKIDTTGPSASIATSVKTDRATVTATCSDAEANTITKYEFSKDGGSTWTANGTTSSYTFTGLKQGTSYTFAIRCTNGLGLTKTASGAKSTASITKPTIAQASQSPSSGTYVQSRVLKITYTATNIQSPEYYFKSSVAATVASGVVTHACGTATNPGGCSASTVTTLAANTWYRTSSTTPSITYKANGYLYAQTWDTADNSAAATTFTISNVDTAVPTVSVAVSGKVATLTLKDNLSLAGYTVTTSTTTPTSWTSVTGTSASKTWTASKAGTYYAWVKDASGRTAYKSFSVASSAFCSYTAGKTWTFAYTGGMQSLAITCNGTYKLEVWGAQGGTVGGAGGLGGYSYGNKVLTSGTTIYIGVGGAGVAPEISSENAGTRMYTVGGYNGGGTSSGYYPESGKGYAGASGGGATHIGTFNSTLAAHGSTSGLYIVAGGGGGGGKTHGWYGDNYKWKSEGLNGGTGGGTSGGNGQIDSWEVYGIGATQTAGGHTNNKTEYSGLKGAFGQGGSGDGKANNIGLWGGGGGGGLYGGGAGWSGQGGGGGSGYIGGVTGGSMQNGQRSGDGYARITLVTISN